MQVKRSEQVAEHHSRKCRKLIAAAAGVLLSSPVLAANFGWDINQGAAGAGGAGSPTGTWDGINAFWNSNTSGTAGTYSGTLGSANTGVISADTDAIGPYTITVSGVQDAQGFIIQEGTPTFTGGTINLPLSASSSDSNALILANSTLAGTALIQSNIQVPATGLFKLTSNATAGNGLELSGGSISAGGSYVLRVGGTGKIRIASSLAPAGTTFGNLQANGTTAWAGTVTLAGAQALGAASIALSANVASTAVLNLGESTADVISLNGIISNTPAGAGATINIPGTVNHGGALTIGTTTVAANLSITGAYNRTSAAATTVIGGSTFNMSGSYSAVGSLAVNGASKVTISGNYSDTAGGSFGGASTVTVTDTGSYSSSGTIRVNGASTLNIAGRYQVLNTNLGLQGATPSDGFLNVTNATGAATLGGNLTIYRGQANIADRTVFVNALRMASSDTAGAQGGAATLSTSGTGKVVLGATPGIQGTSSNTPVTISGNIDVGTLTLDTSPHNGLQYRAFALNNAPLLAVDSTISGSISGNVPILFGGNALAVHQISGSNTFTAGIHDRGTGGAVFMNDGALGAVPSSATDWFLFTAGQLRLGASFDINPNRTFVSYYAAVSAGANATNQNPGIDTRGFNSTFAGKITSQTRPLNGFGKYGAGVLTLTNPNNDYTGSTLVGDGVLAFDSIGNISGGPSALGSPQSGVITSFGAAVDQSLGAMINIGNGTLSVASPTLRYIGPGHASNRPIRATGVGANLEASGSGSLNLTGDVDALAWGLALGGTGDGVVNGTLSASVSGFRGIALATGGAGAGYDPLNPPSVTITDTTGTGATARAIVNPNGTLAGIEVLKAGNNYSATPTVTLGGAPATPAVVGTLTFGTGLLSKSGSGTWRVNTATSSTGTFAVNGGTLAVGHPQALGSGTIELGAAGTVLLVSGLASAVTVPGLNIAAGGKLDVTNNKLVVDYTGASPISALRSAAQAGGILTSVASPSGLAVGYGEASVLYPAGGTFGGVTIAPADTMVLFKPVFSGDVDLDGKVNTLDFNVLAGSFGQSSKVWTDGDVNYDGTVDSLDFTALAGNYGKTLPVLAPSLGSVVPEPATLSALGIAAAMLISRRRR